MSGPRYTYVVAPVWENGEGKFAIIENTYAGSSVVHTRRIGSATTRDSAIAFAKSKKDARDFEEARKAAFFRENPAVVVGEIK